MTASNVQTEHPYIVREPSICGGRPSVRGTRLSVEYIVGQIRAGDTPETLARALPHLSLAAVYDALSFYYDHESEIDVAISSGTPDQVAQEHGFEIGDDGIANLHA